MSLDADLATLRDHAGHDCEGCAEAIHGVEAELSRLREELDALDDSLRDAGQIATMMRDRAEAAEAQSRESSGMYVQANEQITELLQQESFMERKMAAQREDIERLAARVEAAEARCAQLEAERNEYAERLQWLRDLREREGSWGKPYERAMAASAPRGGEPYECEEERDQLAARCARLQQSLRPFVEEYDFHAADYLANDEDARVFSARTVDLLIEHQRAAREALAGPDTPADSQEDKT